MEKYLVIEMQTFEDGKMSTPCFAYDLQAQAEAKYHAILASAAVSELPAHAAILATNGGAVLESKAYFHGTEAE